MCHAKQIPRRVEILKGEWKILFQHAAAIVGIIATVKKGKQAADRLATRFTAAWEKGRVDFMGLYATAEEAENEEPTLQQPDQKRQRTEQPSVIIPQTLTTTLEKMEAQLANMANLQARSRGRGAAGGSRGRGYRGQRFFRN